MLTTRCNILNHYVLSTKHSFLLPAVRFNDTILVQNIN